MELKELIQQDDCSVAVQLTNGQIIKKIGKSVRPLYQIYLENKADMNGAIVADRIIGKAAACLLVDAKVKSVYTFLMSKSAAKLLEAHGICFEYAKLCEYIENRNGTDLCPMEKLIVDIENVEHCIDKIDWFVKNNVYPTTK